ncbi:MAG: SOS response-associated peptidase family protein [Bdellovibrionales bacterium]
MCYSVLVETNLKKLEKEFHAAADIKSFERIYKDRAQQIPNTQIPAALDENFKMGQPLENSQIKKYIRQYHDKKIKELEQKLFVKKREITDLERKLKQKETKTNRSKLETAQRVLKRSLNQLERHKQPSKESSHRIFQYSYAPLITLNSKHQRIIHPFRYQLRPGYNKEEVPSRINMFNARIDALNDRRSWQRVFMHRHAALIMNGFYEWVEDPKTGKSRQIRFMPEGEPWMWVPCLYDQWKSDDGSQIIDSFALLTRDPPAEIQNMGHDRCPVFPKWEHFDSWLDTQTLTEQKAFEIFEDLENVHYAHQWVGQSA